MTIDQATIAAGWYKDPAGSPALRWWDGAQWTSHLQQPAPPAPPVAPPPPAAPAYQAPAQHPPVQQEVNLGAYRPGVGFGAAPQQQTQQTGWGSDPYGTGRRAPIGPINNSSAWISLVAGIVSISSVLIVASVPNGHFFLPVFGITAILAGIRSISRYRRGIVTHLWAPIIGMVLGGIAEVILIAGLIASGMGLSVSTSNTPTTSTSGSGSTSTSPNTLGPTGAATLWDMGYGSPQYLPPSNATLAEVTTAENKVVSALQSTYSPGDVGPSANGKWPTSVNLNSAGDVITSDGHNLGQLVQPGWDFQYKVEANGGYVLAMAASNLNEVAMYASNSDEFVAVCEPSDQTCTTNSPVKSETITGSGSSSSSNSSGSGTT